MVVSQNRGTPKGPPPKKRKRKSTQNFGKPPHILTNQPLGSFLLLSSTCANGLLCMLSGHWAQNANPACSMFCSTCLRCVVSSELRLYRIFCPKSNIHLETQLSIHALEALYITPILVQWCGVQWSSFSVLL